MLVGVNAGHTLSGKGYGAVGLIHESEHTRLVASELLKLLGNRGVNLTVDSSKNYLEDVVKKANASKCDLLVSIHFNAGKGTGCEAYTWRGEKVKEAVNVCEELNKLGFKNRGVKDGSIYYIIRKTRAVCILVEVCFIDTAKDVQLYKKLGAKKIAQAIYKAIK